MRTGKLFPERMIDGGVRLPTGQEANHERRDKAARERETPGHAQRARGNGKKTEEESEDGVNSRDCRAFVQQVRCATVVWFEAAFDSVATHSYHATILSPCRSQRRSVSQSAATSSASLRPQPRRRGSACLLSSHAQFEIAWRNAGGSRRPVPCWPLSRPKTFPVTRSAATSSSSGRVSVLGRLRRRSMGMPASVAPAQPEGGGTF